MLRLRIAAVVCLTLTLLACAASANDWPVYRGNVAHTGATNEHLELPLVEHWRYSSPAAPRKGWAGDDGKAFEGKVIMERVTFDDALHVVVADGLAYFGSSVDHQVHCRRADTGETVWTFFTGGPVRLAPMVAEGRVYFGSDDGCVYCLDAKSGSQIWKLRAGPDDEWMLARGEMISRWPVRTGVLVYKGTAYFGAGIFPHEQVFLYAVDAADGRVVWKRDNISDEDAGRNDLSPQGYLLATDDLLFVPSGRSLPSAFDRRTGALVHKRTHSWRGDAGGVVGGTEALLSDGQIYSFAAHHILAMEQKTGDVGFGYFPARAMSVFGDSAMMADGFKLSFIGRNSYAENSRAKHKLETQITAMTKTARESGTKGDAAKASLQKLLEERTKLKDFGVIWSVPETEASALCESDDKAFVGGHDIVSAYDQVTGRRIWSAPVVGEARGLAIAGGRLYASTTAGEIFCFGAENAKPAKTPSAAVTVDPYPVDDQTPQYAARADEILKQSGVTRGFALVVGGEQGRLAYELAKRSELHVYAVEPDPAKVEAARRALAKTGYYGHRVVVHQADLNDLPYSNYFANLITADGGELPAVNPKNIVRHLKPIGGVVCLGRSDQRAATDAVAWLKDAELAEQATAVEGGPWTMFTRGALPGAGSWTHQYGDPGNTASSQETRVRGDLGVLWFGDPGPTMMVNRHDGAVGPLSVGGRLIVQGDDTVMAYDAYNGVFQWEFKNPEAVRTGVFNNENPGNLAASDDAVFMFAGGQCFEIALDTGKLNRIHRLPPTVDGTTHQWGYIAYRDGLLFGTATMRGEIAAAKRRRGKATNDSTDVIFAINVATGEHAWQYQGKSISHHTVALGPDRVFFIDSSITAEQRAALLRQDKTPLQNLSPEEAKAEEERLKKFDIRFAVALDSHSGKQLWALPVDVTDCSEIGIGGGKLTMLYDKGVLVLCGANANGHYWPQFVAGEFAKRRLVALGADGKGVLWAKDANYRHRPIIVGDRVIAEPWSFNLYSGEQQMRLNEVTQQVEPWSIMRTGHHCGMLTGCENMLFFRSGFTGFYDLEADVGAQHFAGHRLGCWINAIPANGLVMIPEAGAGCVCLFSIESTVVFEPRPPRRPWAIYSSVGALTPVKHLAVNLGAPGDRRDAHGTVWLTYPRPKPYRETGLETKLDVAVKFADGGGYEAVNEESTPIAGTETPWVFTSWARGMTECSIPLRGKNDGPADYDVTLHFTDAAEGTATRKPFDVKVQGKEVFKGLDIAAEAGGTRRALTRKLDNVRVTDQLTIELVAKSSGLTPEQMPTLSAIEIKLSERTTSNEN